jgi:hypothetical protein
LQFVKAQTERCLHFARQAGDIRLAAADPDDRARSLPRRASLRSRLADIPFRRCHSLIIWHIYHIRSSVICDASLSMAGGALFARRIWLTEPRVRPRPGVTIPRAGMRCFADERLYPSQLTRPASRRCATGGSSMPVPALPAALQARRFPPIGGLTKSGHSCRNASVHPCTNAHAIEA